MSIKSRILQKALRAMKVETDYTNADDTAYERIFESYQDMIDLWNEQGIVLYDSLPLEMNQPVGNGDPIYALWTNLVIHASDSFAWMPTQKQLNEASRSLRILRARQDGPNLMRRPKRQPRGTGNRWYNCTLGFRHYRDYCDTEQDNV